MDPENRATLRLGTSRVPASARSPESMRAMYAYDGSPLDENDEDVDFIANLAREAEASIVAASGGSPARASAALHGAGGR